MRNGLRTFILPWSIKQTALRQTRSRTKRPCRYGTFPLNLKHPQTLHCLCWACANVKMLQEHTHALQSHQSAWYSYVIYLMDLPTIWSNDSTSVTPATIPKQPGSVAVASGMLHLTFHVCAISLQASQPLHLSQGSLPARETTPEWKLCKMQTKKQTYPESPHSWDPHSWLASKRQPSSIKRVWAATKRWTHAWSTASPAARLTLPTHVLCRRRARTHARTQT